MSQPSTAYRQHHDVEAPRVDASAFRQGWRVVTRLDALLATRRISPGQWEAAVQYRNAWARVMRAHGGSSQAGMRRIANADAMHARLGYQLDTITLLREIEAQIGQLAAWRCFACVVQDQSWHAIGRRLRCNHETARDWTVFALRALAVAARRAGASRRREANGK